MQTWRNGWIFCMHLFTRQFWWHHMEWWDNCTAGNSQTHVLQESRREASPKTSCKTSCQWPHVGRDHQERSDCCVQGLWHCNILEKTFLPFIHEKFPPPNCHSFMQPLPSAVFFGSTTITFQFVVLPPFPSHSKLSLFPGTSSSREYQLASHLTSSSISFPSQCFDPFPLNLTTLHWAWGRGWVHNWRLCLCTVLSFDLSGHSLGIKETVAIFCVQEILLTSTACCGLRCWNKERLYAICMLGRLINTKTRWTSKCGCGLLALKTPGADTVGKVELTINLPHGRERLSERLYLSRSSASPRPYACHDTDHTSSDRARDLV